MSSAVAEGHSVMLMHALISADECAALRAAGKTAAQGECPAPRLRLPVDDCLTADDCHAAHAIVRRALALIESDIPELAGALFGQTTGLRTMELLFAKGEPAINVYEVGGDFEPHRDKQTLSVLIPLTAPESFTGGGTAFWSEEMTAGRRVRRGCETPACLLRPPAGDAMLFCGELMHAALPVTHAWRAASSAALIGGEGGLFVSTLHWARVEYYMDEGSEGGGV